jgi:lysozyme
VDISHHNGTVNWTQLKNEGVAFTYIKATEGTTHTDSKYKENYPKAKEADLKVGTYHFYTFGLDGEEQANHFIRHAKVGRSDLIPAIDVEHSPCNKYSSDKDYIERVIGELQKLEQTMFDHYGVHPIIYTNKNCYALYVKDHLPDNLIWMSDLHNEPTIKENEWIIWQFSHTGRLNGAIGDIDLNYFRYSYRQFNELTMDN